MRGATRKAGFNARRRWLVVAAACLAVSVTVPGALAATGGAATRATRPRVGWPVARVASALRLRGPSSVRPGRRVTLIVSGFPAYMRIRVQFGVLPIRNCCVTAVIPTYTQPGYPVGRSGARTLIVVMPREWEQCVAASCSSPDLRPFRKGQRIFVAAFTDSDAYFVRYDAAVT